MSNMDKIDTAAFVGALNGSNSSSEVTEICRLAQIHKLEDRCDYSILSDAIKCKLRHLMCVGESPEKHVEPFALKLVGNDRDRLLKQMNMLKLAISGEQMKKNEDWINENGKKEALEISEALHRSARENLYYLIKEYPSNDLLEILKECRKRWIEWDGNDRTIIGRALSEAICRCENI